VLLGVNVDWQQFSETLTAARWLYVLIGLGTVLLIALLEAGRIGVAFKAHGVGWAESLRLHVIGTLFGSVLPGQVGNDAYKVFKLRHKAGGFIQPTAVLIGLRTCGLMALVAGAAVSGAAYWNDLSDLFSLRAGWWRSGGYWLMALAVAVVGVAALTLSWAAYDQRKAGGQTIVSRLVDARAQARAAFQALGWGPIGMIFWLSGIIVLVRTGTLLVITWAVDANLAFLGAMLVATMAALGTQLPVSIAGLGVREGLIVILMTQLGVGYEQAVVAALISRAFIVAVTVIGAIWVLVEAFARRRGKRQPS
jgi:uncharacterized membrane protein YbhN (UPF0104 family)